MAIDLKKLQKQKKNLQSRLKRISRYKKEDKKIERLVPQPKRFILERERATIVLKSKEPEPIRSLFFKDEFIKEKDKELRFLS